MSTDVDVKDEVKKKTRKDACPVGAFQVENVHPRNCDMLIQSIPGCKLRGPVRHVKEVTSPHKGNQTTTAPSGVIPGIPDVPGQQLHIFPASCRVKIVDPLYGDEETCATIKAVLTRTTGMKRDNKLSGIPTSEQTLEPSRMKTLCREVMRMIEAGTMSLVKGHMPEIEDIDKLPGKYLLNPGSIVANTQPRYEEDFEDWVDDLSTRGG